MKIIKFYFFIPLVIIFAQQATKAVCDAYAEYRKEVRYWQAKVEEDRETLNRAQGMLQIYGGRAMIPEIVDAHRRSATYFERLLKESKFRLQDAQKRLQQCISIKQ